MSKAIRTAKVRLVTVIVPSEHSDAFMDDLDRIGTTGYTSVKAEGRGHHGRRRAGVILDANVRIEVLAAAEVAAEILALVANKYSSTAVVAFVVDVEALPHTSFG